MIQDQSMIKHQLLSNIGTLKACVAHNLYNETRETIDRIQQLAGGIPEDASATCDQPEPTTTQQSPVNQVAAQLAPKEQEPKRRLVLVMPWDEAAWGEYRDGEAAEQVRPLSDQDQETTLKYDPAVESFGDFFVQAFRYIREATHVVIFSPLSKGIVIGILRVKP